MPIVHEPRRHRCRISTYVRSGHEFIVLENAEIRVTVLLSKGADITEFRHKKHDLDLLWRSPQELLPPGQTITTVERDNGAFLDHFPGGWQEVLPNGGDACTYRGAKLGQHGEVALLPWTATVVEDTPDRISVRFAVRTRRTPFRLERTMTIIEHEPVLEMQESVTNEGGERLAYMWGHHPGFGPPFIEPGCTIDLPEGGVIATPAPTPASPAARFIPGRRSPWPSAEDRNGDMVRLDVTPPSDTGTTDSVTVSGLAEGWAAVTNPRLGCGIGLVWDIEVFPFVWCWTVWGSRSGYPFYGKLQHLAIEPFSSPIGTLVENVTRGTAPELDPGETASTTMSVVAYDATGRITGFDGTTPVTA